MTPVNRYIGAPIERVEDLRFLRGRGEYVADLVRQGMLHAAILRSPIAHGLIRLLDRDPALAIPGVHAVITAVEIGAVNGNSRLVWRTFTAFGNMTTLIANSWPSVY